MDSLHWEPEQLKHMQEQQVEQKDKYKRFKEKLQVTLDQLPTHYEFLKENIYN
jgi:hypothetical protein